MNTCSFTHTRPRGGARALPVAMAALALLAALSVRASAPSGPSAGLAGPASDAPVPGVLVGQITSPDSVSYCSGAGPWVTQGGAAFPAVTPLSVRTGASPCRIEFGTQALFEALPASELTVTSQESGGLELSIIRGTVIYAVADRRALKIRVPAVGQAATVGQTQAADGAVAQSVYAAASERGLARVHGEAGKPQVEWMNLAGRMSVSAASGQTRPVAPNESLNVGADQPLESAAVSEAALKPLARDANRARAALARETPGMDIADRWRMADRPGFAEPRRGPERVLESPEYGTNCNDYERPPCSPYRPRWVWCWKHWRWCTEQHWGR